MDVNSSIDSAAASVELESSSVLRWDNGAATILQDAVAREEPLEIRVQGRCVAITMRTPGSDAALAAGFLLSEGILRHRGDLLEIAPCMQGPAALEGNILNVFLRAGLEVDFDKLSRHVFASSSCGLCGKASIQAVHQQFAPVESACQIKADVMLSLPERLRAMQQTFSRTGGLHAAGIFDLGGECVHLCEDVGRHNAVDKAIGACFIESRLPLDHHVLLVSGRASFEIVQKALSARIPILAAISAPSSLAIKFAQESGQTLAGFVRGKTMNVYSHPERIVRAS